VNQLFKGLQPVFLFLAKNSQDSTRIWVLHFCLEKNMVKNGIFSQDSLSREHAIASSLCSLVAL
jgi:hypothetical protein